MDTRRVIVERSGAENDIFPKSGRNFEGRGSELADRFLSRFSSILFPIVVATERDWSAIRARNVRIFLNDWSNICISFRGQFYTPLQPNEIRIIITDGRRGKETLSFSNTFHPCDKIAHRFHNGKGTFDSKEREKKFPPRAKRVFPPSIIIAVPSRAVYK